MDVPLVKISTLDVYVVMGYKVKWTNLFLEKEWIFRDITAYRTVSIKRPGLIFLQKSLLNVQYDQKIEGLNILSNWSYNRMVRVFSKIIIIKINHIGDIHL